MGLAPYGDPRKYYTELASLIQLNNDGTYSIPVFAKNVTRLEKETHRGILRELSSRFGPAREPGTELTQTHKDVAASLQAVLSDSWCYE